MSDHSSHFDSVLGTAINLGIHSVNEKGGLHYPKVSALAREAKELQGVRTKKEEKQAEGLILINQSIINYLRPGCIKKLIRCTLKKLSLATCM